MKRPHRTGPTRRYSQQLLLTIEPPRFLREALVRERKKWRKQLEQDARWVPALALHLTLRHLGELEVSKSKLLSKKLTSAVAGIEPFQVSLAGLAGYPSLDQARTLFLDVNQCKPLKALLGAVEGCCRQLALGKAKHPFESRIVLARCKEPQSFAELELPPELLGFTVRSVSLLESRSGQNGLTLHPLRRFELGSATNAEAIQ